jgi:hypothetical protein
MSAPLKLLENYSRSHPHEVLIVKVRRPSAPILDELMIYKGFASALSFATDPDPDVPLIPPDTEIVAIDRYHAPYHLRSARPIQVDISWGDFVDILP